MTRANRWSRLIFRVPREMAVTVRRDLGVGDDGRSDLSGCGEYMRGPWPGLAR